MRPLPRAWAGGILAVGGSLIPLFEDGVSAVAPAPTATLDPAHAAAALDQVRSETRPLILIAFAVPA